MRGAVVLPIALLLLAGCGHVWEKVDLSSLPTAEAVPDARHVILLDETTVRFLPAGDKTQIESTYHRRLKILRPQDDFNIYVRYSKAMSKVTQLNARVIPPDGKEKTYGREAALDKGVRSEVMFSDDRVLRLALEQPPVGSVVEWEYTVVSSDPHYFPAGASMQDYAPIKEERFTVEHPEGWEIEVVHMYGDATPEAPVSHADGMVKRSWVAHDVPRAKGEEHEADWDLPQIAVRLMKWVENGEQRKGFATAQELSDWSSTLYPPTEKLDPDLQKIFDKVLAGAPDDPKEKTRRLYDWVKDEIEYCAIEVGWGGWKPIPPKDVARVRYGDCKGKAELLHTLLTAAGITSHPTLVTSHHRQPIPFQLQLLGYNFNHAIDVVDLPGGRMVLDPTDREPFGQLPMRDQGADLLPIVKGGEPIMKAPALGPDENREEQSLDIELLPSGEVKGKLELKAWKGFASGYEEDFRWVAKKKLHRILESNAGLPVDSAGEPTVHARASFEDPMTIEAETHWQPALHYGQTQPLLRFMESWLPSLPPGNRQHPVWLGAASSRRQQIAVKLPENMSAMHLPDAVEAHSQWGDYRMTVRMDNGVLRIDRELKVVKGEVDPSAYPELVAFLDKVHAGESQAILLGNAR